MDTFNEGLRCQDVHAGLRNIDPSSGVLRPLMDTRLIGMASTLASLIRGQDVIADAAAVQAVAAEQLDVDLFAFNEVVSLLNELGYVSGVVMSKGKIERFTESVPFYSDLYRDLGAAWHERGPSQLEEQVVSMVDRLASSPVPLDVLTEDLNVQSADLQPLLELGSASHLLKIASTSDGDIAYSPFFAFENPLTVNELVSTHGSDQLIEEFAQLSNHQGFPVDSATTPILSDAVARGFLLAPSVQLPDGRDQPFATLPYILAPDLLSTRKPVLEKALAVIACLRCGQHFGGHTGLSPTALDAVLEKLLDPSRGFLQPHSSHARQYALMHRAGLIAFGDDLRPGGNWVTPRFIDTADNREAFAIARELLNHGERLTDRVGDDAARGMLDQGAPFAAPMQTIAKYRAKAPADPKHWTAVVNAAMSRGTL